MAKAALEGGGGDVGVGGKEDEHGSHIWSNHSGAFGDSGDGYFFGVEFDFSGGDFLDEVGGEDGLGEVFSCLSGGA